MHKSLLTALVLVGALTLPASAQMCGSGQQTQATGTGGMMCGATRAADDPMADKSQKPQATGMCACCKNMAMMKGGGMMGGPKDPPSK